jgi:5-methylcytosine-specific restriction endonuclease McrA
LIRKRRMRKKTARSHSKVCLFCGMPVEFAVSRDRKAYDWYINKSVLWQSIREWALLRAGHKCEKCGAEFPLQVHHKTYARLGKEGPDDLIVLCESCHEEEHK